MFNLFGKSKDIHLEGLGKFIFQDQAWLGIVKLNDELIEISLDGKKHGPNDFAIGYLRQQVNNLSRYWEFAVEFAQKELVNHAVDIETPKSVFKLLGISIHEQNSFDNGHLVFWFDIETDKNGSYYVSFKDEKPTLLHRE